MIQPDSTQLISDSTKHLPDSIAKLDSLATVDSLRLVDSLKSIVHIVVPRGHLGIPLPSLPETAGWVFVTLVLLFLLFVFSISRYPGIITDTSRTFFQVKERSSIFSKATSNDLRYRSYFTLFSIGVLSFYVYLVLNNSTTNFSLKGYCYYLLITAVFFGLKSLMIDILGYVFFEPASIKMAKDSYFDILSILGIFLFPLLILQIYIPNNYSKIVELTSLVICTCAVILVIIKLFQIFFHKIAASFYIMLYLCTLEILPLILLYRVYLSIG